MSQDEINEAEWNNPDNWSGYLYFSKKDNRVWVPKQIGGAGLTINIGQKKGAAYMTWTFVAAIIIVVAAFIVALIWANE
ncbi:MAG TPA: hypothetical protein VH280_21065 [Verrucomicrobiae bacterium]|jgi:uncharacterized membrane protein|nr:hypothetical protein [Verrucomicrobiae bacterium]